MVVGNLKLKFLDENEDIFVSIKCIYCESFSGKKSFLIRLIGNYK